MADSSLIDIFDLCVERLATGETVEDCLRDYPAYADELRSMLEMSLLVFQAQSDSDAEQQAQAHTRSRIEEALDTDFVPRKGKNSFFSLRRSVIWIGGAAAAVFAFAFGYAFVTAPRGPQVSYAPMSDTDFRLTATQFVWEVTLTAQASAEDADNDGLIDVRELEVNTDAYMADTDSDGLNDGDEVRVWNTNPLNRDTDGDSVSDGEEINVLGTDPLGTTDTFQPINTENEFILTATQYVKEITQTAQAEFTLTATQHYEEVTPTAQALVPQSTSAENEFILTATQYAKEITQTAQAMMESTATATVTSTATTTVTSTPMPTMTLISPGSDVRVTAAGVAIEGAYVSTSVASYLPMTATLGPLAASIEKDKDALIEPVVADAEADREDSRDLGAGDDTYGYSTDVMPLPTSAPPSISLPDTGGGLMAPVAPNQQQLDPMKAGEIDDNAEWDTYTAFRRNYADSFGTYGIMDFDVADRRIIKVVDALGNPILGARVEVFMDDIRVSDTLTYATGLTLFFPNAKKTTQRRDAFTVIVTVDQFYADRPLNLNSVGDVLEIRMPVVIVREETSADAADVNATAIAENTEAAARDATAAAQNADTASRNATVAAENAQAAFEAAATASAVMASQNAGVVPSSLPDTAYPTHTPLPSTR